jgi:D-inositol-3-phosphate glycosyltransferase
MKVSMIEPIGGHGGMNYYDFGLCEGISSSGDCEITLYTSDVTKEESDSFKVVKNFKKIWGDGNKFLRLFRYFLAFIKSCIDSKYRSVSIVHLHLFHVGYLELLSVFLCKLFRFKIVVTVHDVESFKNEDSLSLYKTYLGQCSSLIVHNNFSYDELIKINKKCGLEIPISIVKHGNYIPFINRYADDNFLRSRLNIAEGKKVVLFFGQIKKVKGLDLLIDAVKYIDRDDYVVIIAGKVWKDDFESYAKQIKGTKKEGMFHTDIRYIPDEEVDSYYALADVVALPYRRIYQSGVLLMAMSYGKCVIASDLKPMKEIVIDGYNGFTFKSGDSKDLANRISMALESDLGIINETANMTMVNDYSWEKVGLNCIQVYKQNV